MKLQSFYNINYYYLYMTGDTMMMMINHNNMKNSIPFPRSFYILYFEFMEIHVTAPEDISLDE